MEYRRKRKAIGKASHGGLSPSGIYALLVLAALTIVGVIYFSSVGNWLSERVFAPVFAWMDPQEDAPASIQLEPVAQMEGATIRTSALSLPGITCSAVQIGIYTNEENARKQAEALKKLGAAGYVISDGKQYRVLAAGYLDSTSLASVRDNLSKQGLETTSYTMQTASVKIVVSAQQTQIDGIERYLKRFAVSVSDVAALAIRFEKENLSCSDGLASLSSLLSEAESALSEFSATVRESNVFTEELSGCARDVMAQMQQVIDVGSKEKIVLSSQLKYLFLYICDCYCNFSAVLKNN